MHRRAPSGADSVRPLPIDAAAYDVAACDVAAQWFVPSRRRFVGTPTIRAVHDAEYSVSSVINSGALSSRAQQGAGISYCRAP